MYCVNTLTLSLAMEANLLAPTVKLLQPCQKKDNKKKDCHRSRISTTESKNLPKVINMLTY